MMKAHAQQVTIPDLTETKSVRLKLSLTLTTLIAILKSDL
jgi:hypothetical protein